MGIHFFELAQVVFEELSVLWSQRIDKQFLHFIEWLFKVFEYLIVSLRRMHIEVYYELWNITLAKRKPKEGN